MPPVQHPSQIARISVGGTPLRADIANGLIDAVVDDDLHLPDMFELRFSDPQRTFADDSPFTIGATVEITTGMMGEDASTTLIVGEVTAIEANHDFSGSFLTVSGYDHSHRLHRGSNTKTWNDITDSDLIKRIAQAAGLTIGTIDPTDETHEHVGQVNESDWSFIQRRARAAGCRVFVKDGTFNMSSGVDADDDPAVDLRFGMELREFRARMSATEQVGNVEVRGWDVANKKAISQTVETSIDTVSLTSSSIKADTIDNTFGSATHVQTDVAIGKDATAKMAAQAAKVDRSSGQLFATGSIEGNPKVRANASVNILGSGNSFDGQWTISHSRHVFDGGGYRTEFTVSGNQDRSYAGLIAGIASNSAKGSSGGSVPRMPGVVIGLVTDNADPLDQGRVKVKMPWLDDGYESFWARVCYPGAGNARGMVLVPEINDEVLVAFEQGSADHPYVIGSLFNGVDVPDGKSVSGDGVTRRAWTSRKGHKIVMLEDPQSPDDDMINIVTKKGVLISVKDNGEVTVDAKNAVFNLSQGFTIAAEGDISISGNKITLDAKMDFNLTAKGGATIDGGPLAQIKGGMVLLNP